MGRSFRIGLRACLSFALVAAASCGSSDSPAGPDATVPPPRNIRVSTDANPRPNEVAVAVDPSNPLNVVAGSNLDFAYYSWDGGQTWQERRIVSDAFGVWGDPSLVFDSEGSVYYAHLSNPAEGVGYRIDRIVVQRSTDHGASFGDGAAIGHRPPRHQDKSWIAADRTASPHSGSLYVAWTEFDQYGSADPAHHSRIVLSRSTDHGTSWSEPVVVSDTEGTAVDGDTTVEGAVPAVGPGGEVYTSWGGPLGIVFDRSLDGGATFGADVFVGAQPGGWAFDVPGLRRVNGMPVTVCDTSDSPWRGRVYVVWSDQRNGTDDTDVFVSSSSDRGATWSAARRVNDDTLRRHQFFQWAAVDPLTGFLYVVFYDRRDTSGDATDVFLARSTDGGASFENRRISESSFTPDTTRFLGDYIGVAAHGGRVHPVWTRQDGDTTSIWTAFVDDRS